VNQATGALSALRRLGIAIAIAVVFLFGLATTVYLSLRSPEVTVPDVIGKDRFQAEQILGDAGLNFRVRATRASNELKADTVLFQLPRGGEVVKVGQTVAMDISRTAKEGESSEAVVEKTPEEKAANQNSNESTANENKPRRRPANKNDNANDNRNANRSNRNGNSNAKSNTNSNRPVPNTNGNRNSSNANPRPSTPRPSPVAQPTKATP
jgi:beta-lactam-binding protein with PASTA domain